MLLYGALEELCFNSILDRMKLTKLDKFLKDEVNPRVNEPVYPCTHRHEFARCNHKLVISSSAATMPVELILTSEDGRLSAPGLRRLAVACWAAFEIVVAACERAMDASLWIRVPGAIHSIDATMQAYEFMR